MSCQFFINLDSTCILCDIACIKNFSCMNEFSVYGVRVFIFQV
ncbi:MULTISPECIES: hypothetical protein [Helicobacter]|nr:MULTISPECIES: hypothetical protein [Helicobacter]